MEGNQFKMLKILNLSKGSAFIDTTKVKDLIDILMSHCQKNDDILFTFETESDLVCARLTGATVQKKVDKKTSTLILHIE